MTVVELMVVLKMMSPLLGSRSTAGRGRRRIVMRPFDIRHYDLWSGQPSQDIGSQVGSLVLDGFLRGGGTIKSSESQPVCPSYKGDRLVSLARRLFRRSACII